MGVEGVKDGECGWTKIDPALSCMYVYIIYMYSTGWATKFCHRISIVVGRICPSFRKLFDLSLFHVVMFNGISAI